MPHTTQDILRAVRSLDPASLSERERLELRDAFAAASVGLETPWECAMRIIATQPAQAACLKVCCDIGLFRAWVERFDGGSVAVEQLLGLVDVEETLLVRVLRHLHATNIILQPATGSYQLTSFSKALGTSPLESIIPFSFDFTIPGFANLPSYLERIGYRNPTDSTSTNWHHMRGVSRFDELKQHPEKMAVFQDVMTANAASKVHWTDLFPIDRLVEAYQSDAPLLVDVGGGAGHDIETFHQRLNDIHVQLPAGSLVLQDMKSVVDAAVVDPTVSKFEHDIFQPQPIKGAAAYYLHTVLHDWDDDQAATILRNLAAAAEPGYSRILIHETIVRDCPSALTTSTDLQMMMTYSACERTEKVWRDIVGRAGLEVVGIWGVSGGVESVIEAVRPKAEDVGRDVVVRTRI